MNSPQGRELTEETTALPDPHTSVGGQLQPLAWYDSTCSGNVRWRSGAGQVDVAEGEGLIPLSHHQQSRVADASRIAELEAERNAIYDAFGFGEQSRVLSTLTTNLGNLRHFSELLQAIEREFFMVPGEPSDERGDAGLEPDDQCLVNRWGSTRGEYVDQFRAALAPIAAKELSQSAGKHGAYLVVDPMDNHHICYSTTDFDQAQQWTVDGLQLYSPFGPAALRRSGNP